MFLYRHVAVSPQSVDTTDKFRIHMFEEGTNEVRYLFDSYILLYKLCTVPRKANFSASLQGARLPT